MEQEFFPNRLAYRRALEAMRSGVPNRDVVAVLGSNQPDAEREFSGLIARLSDGQDPPDSSLGMLVAGDFGSGKSHLLEFLQNVALTQGFVCSRVVISKETPLFDLEKVFKAAVENARVPGLTGHMVEEIVSRLRYDSDPYARFSEWSNRGDNGLNRLLPATLVLHEKLNGQEELSNKISWFWSGDKIELKAVRDGLKSINQQQAYSFKSLPARQWPRQKLKFVLELIKAAGYRGWVILMDEIELVANYSVLQRGRSYAEIARWMGQVAEENYPGLVLVGTVTADFASVVLDQKEDRDKAAERLRARQREEDAITAARAETGMRLIERGVRSLAEPDNDTLSTIYDRLRKVHSEAYGWDAPQIAHGIGVGVRRRMRSYVRRWINEWDLRRLYPESEPDIEENELQFSYGEDTTLEHSHSDDEAPSVREVDRPPQLY